MRTVVLGWNPELEAMICPSPGLGCGPLRRGLGLGVPHGPVHHREHALVTSSLLLLLHPFAEAAGLIGTAAFNLGEPNNYRVPDLGYHRVFTDAWSVATAAAVVEIVHPDDEAYDKSNFYGRARRRGGHRR